MSVQVSYKKQIVVGLLLLSVFLLSIEGAVRIMEFFDPPNCSWINRDALDSVEFFRKRQLCSDVNQLVYEESPIRLIVPNQHFTTININSLGFRGEETTNEKLDDVYRIFVVGGSTVFGAGATSDENTVPGFLQKKFDNSNLQFKVEVINAGIPGSHSLWEAYYVKNSLVNLQPDLIIVYDGWNDAGGLALNAKINTDDTIKEEFEFRFKNFPFYRTPFFISYNFLKNSPTTNQSHDKTDSIDNEIVVNSWKESWNDICQLGNKEGFKTVVLVQASTRSGNKVLSEDERVWSDVDPMIVERLSGMATSLSDLNETCDKTMDMRYIFDDISEPLFYDAAHTNDLGNEIIAEKIFELTMPLLLQHN